MPADPTLREPVLWFANQMEVRLREDLRDQTGWRDWKRSEQDIFRIQLVFHVKELSIAISHSEPSDIISEAAEVACFAMMIADLARLRMQPPKPEMIIEDDDGEIG